LSDDNTELLHELKYSNPQKIDILKLAFQEIHTQRRGTAALENKVSFSFSILLLIFASFILKGDYSLSGHKAVVAGGFVICATYVAVWFLRRTGDLMRTQCKMIVRIEQSLGLYEPEMYISKKQIEKMGNIPFPEASVFPPDASKWGTVDRWLTVTPHIVGVICAGSAAFIAILVRM